MSKVLDAIVDTVKAVAPAVANYIVPGSGPLLHTLIRQVAGEPPETPIEAAAAKVVADPALYIELQKRALEHEEKLLELDVRRQEAVNATMREEAKSERWPQYSWRPYNGFLYGTTIFCVYVLLPLCKVPVPSVPEWVWIGWGAILGVTTWHRGKEKRIKAGEARPGLLESVTKVVRGG